MKIIDRYITRGFIWPFLYCLFIFLFLYIIVDLFGHLDIIIKQSVPFKSIRTYYLASIPFIFVQTTPFAVLLATVFLLSNLNRHNEIIALRASGINSLRIIAPILMLGIAISLGVYFVNERIVPESSVTSAMIKELKFEKGQQEKRDILENITIFGKDGKLFYARSYELQSKTLHDIVILEHNKEQILRRKITATRMEWSEDRWRFFDCDIFRFDKEGNIIGKPTVASTKILQFKETPESLLKNQTQTEFMNYSQLREYIRLLSIENKSTARKMFVDMYYKLSLPFTSVTIMLIGIPFALKRTRAGAVMSMGISLAIAVVFYGANAIFLALGKGGFLPAIVSAWAANIIFAAIGIFLIKKVRV